MCKLGAALFSVSRNESLLQGAIERHTSGQHAELGEELAAALDAVDARDMFAVMNMSAMPTGGFKYMAVGVNVNGSLDSKMVIVMEDKATAQEMVDGMEKALEMM